MKVCKGCVISPLTNRCQYGGPFRCVPARDINVTEYINVHYGPGLPPVHNGKQWTPRFASYGFASMSWSAYLKYIKQHYSARP